MNPRRTTPYRANVGRMAHTQGSRPANADLIRYRRRRWKKTSPHSAVTALTDRSRRDSAAGGRSRTDARLTPQRWCGCGARPHRLQSYQEIVRNTPWNGVAILASKSQRTESNAWHSGRTSVFGRPTFLVLRSTCSWRVTIYVGKPSAIGQLTRPTQPFIPSGR